VFVEHVSGWIEIQHASGADAVGDVYVEMLENRTRPMRLQSEPARSITAGRDHAVLGSARSVDGE